VPVVGEHRPPTAVEERPAVLHDLDAQLDPAGRELAEHLADLLLASEPGPPGDNRQQALAVGQAGLLVCLVGDLKRDQALAGGQV